MINTIILRVLCEITFVNLVVKNFTTKAHKVPH